MDGVAIPVAAGVVHEASLHPERLWAYIEVARDHRRAGIGSTLLTMLRHEAEQAPSGVSKLRCKVEPGTPGAAFAEAAGPGPDPALPPRGRGARRRSSCRCSATAPESAATDQVEDLATGSVELSDVVGRYYTAVHGWDSPGELSVATVQRLFLDDLSGAHGAIVLRAPKASAFGHGVAASRKGRLEGVRHQLCAGTAGDRRRRSRARPARPSPRTSSWATSPSSARMRPGPPCGTCWP